MLRVEGRFEIRELYGKGVSLSEIARPTGQDRKTIRAAVRQPLLPARRPARPRRASKLAPSVPYLKRRLADGVLNAHKRHPAIAGQRCLGLADLRAPAIRPPPRLVARTVYCGNRALTAGRYTGD